MVDRTGELAATSSLDTAMVATMRCLLALVTLIVMGTTGGMQASPVLSYATLLSYCGYSVVLLALALRGHAGFARAQPWIDVLFFSALVGLTGFTQSVFFHYFLFAIIVASFSRGFREGLLVTLASVLCFSALGFAGSLLGGVENTSQAATRAVSLFLLGYLIAYWGRQEIALRGRLGLLRELAAFSSPRVQRDKIMERMLARLLDFFDARSCVLIVPKPDAKSHVLYRLGRTEGPGSLHIDEVGIQLGQKLLDLPDGVGITFDGSASLLGSRGPRLMAWSASGERCNAGCATLCTELSVLLETAVFATVPFKQSDGVIGRLFLLSPGERLGAQDIEYLTQTATQMGAAINNALLLEDLTRTATQQERSKISRDIHDTTVQSYIGLKLGLEALYRDIGPSAPGAARIKELLDMASLTVDDLRKYIDRLSGRAANAPEKALMAQLEEQRRRYSDYHGMKVDLRAQGELHLNERVASEAYRVVSEALSNVFRHTKAREASVDLRCDDANLAIEIGNDTDADRTVSPFLPRTISERAISLGGKVQVQLNKGGRDIVRVTMPLRDRRRMPRRADQSARA